MAVLDNLDEDQQKAAGGQVLAGNSGAASGNGTPTTGSGFTNLQTYLTANKGQGEGVANDIIAGGQTAFDANKKQADDLASGFGAYGAQQANNAATQGTADLKDRTAKLSADPSYNYDVNAKATYGGPQKAEDITGYQTADGTDQNFNSLDAAYKKAEDSANSYAGDYNAQKAALQQKNGYGNGFAALDTFLGRQDAGNKITDWQNKAVGGLKDSNGNYQGTMQAKNTIDGAINQGIAGASQANADYKAAQQKAEATKQAQAQANIATNKTQDAANPFRLPTIDELKDYEQPASAGIPIRQDVVVTKPLRDSPYIPKPTTTKKGSR